MKALVIHGKEDMRLEELARPEPKMGEVLMKVAYAGVCGSDLHYYFNGANGDFKVIEPLIPGHEICGWVEHDPSGKYETKTPITLHPATFGTCIPGLEKHPHLWPKGAYLGSASTKPHTQGGMSEFFLLRLDQVRVLPHSLPMKRAVLCEPLAVAMHAVNRAKSVENKDVLINGSGPIGLLVAFAALKAGARSVRCSDLHEEPLKRSLYLGCDRGINLLKESLPSEEFDVVFECSGSPKGISAAIKATKRLGNLVQVGMLSPGEASVELGGFISKEVHWHGVFRFNDEIDACIKLLANSPELDCVLTHVLGLEEGVKAFEIAKDSKISSKVALAL